MKLWKKISFICIAILIIVGTISYGGFTHYAKNKFLDTEIEYQQKMLSNVADNFAQKYYANELSTDSETVRKSLAIYVFNDVAEGNMMLYEKGVPLYSKYSFDPEEYLMDDYFCQVFIDGNHSLIVKWENYFLEEYCFYNVVNMQGIYDNLNLIFRGYLLLNTVVILVGVLLIALSVKISLRPLKKLEDTTKIIASGDYTKRIEVKNRDEIGNLSLYFNQMTEEIENKMIELTKRIEQQKLFIGAVSHEYKTPITAMLLHLDMLQNMYLEEEKQRQSLHILESQCVWLENLTQKLLQITTLSEQKNLAQKEYKFGELFQMVKESTAAILKEKQQVLIITEGKGVQKFDMDLLHSALVNLIVNASRASEPKREIHLIEVEHGIVVKDFGIGMEPCEIEKIIEPFYRVDASRNRKTGGFGLGLALVNEIVKVHGATLNIESGLQKGTTVTIIFS